MLIVRNLSSSFSYIMPRDDFLSNLELFRMKLAHGLCNRRVNIIVLMDDIAFHQLGAAIVNDGLSAL